MFHSMMYHGLSSPMLLDVWVVFQSFVTTSILSYFEGNEAWCICHTIWPWFIYCIMLKNYPSIPILSAEKAVFVSPSLG